MLIRGIKLLFLKLREKKSWEPSCSFLHTISVRRAFPRMVVQEYTKMPAPWSTALTIRVNRLRVWPCTFNMRPYQYFPQPSKTQSEELVLIGQTNTIFLEEHERAKAPNANEDFPGICVWLLSPLLVKSDKMHASHLFSFHASDSRSRVYVFMYLCWYIRTKNRAH